MIKRLLPILLFVQFFYGQEQLPQYIDSLAQADLESEKARLSMVIASQLADEDWKRALHYVDFAEKSAKKSKSDSILADTHRAMAWIYANKEAFDISLDYFVKAFSYYRNKPLKERLNIENELAIAYSKTQQTDKALLGFEKIAKYGITRESPSKLAATYNNLALVWMQKDVDSAMVYFKKSLSIIQDVDNPRLKVFLYTNLGRGAASQGNVREAKKYFNWAIKESNQLGNAKLPWIYGEFSEIYLGEGKLDSAIFYSKKAVEILDTVAPFSMAQLQGVDILYRAYLQNKDFEKASQYFEKYVDITDSLNIEDRRINVQKLVLDEEYRNKDKIRELEERESRAHFYTLIVGLVAILLILGSFLFHYRNRLRRTELEKLLVTSRQNELSSTLELKNKELIGKAMIEMHRSEIIQEVLQDLKEVKLKAEKKETQNAIDYIAARLKRDTDTNVWDEFELRFEQVHETFYRNLIREHPDLSPRDKRLCALLKLNLTSKEISQITGQSLKTVENARTRLRKKLDITNFQTDLSAYLSKFG